MIQNEVKQKNHEYFLVKRPFIVPIRLLNLSPENKSKLHLHLLEFREDSVKGVKEMAKSDLKSGHKNILAGGFTPYTDKVIAYLDKKYSINVIFLSSCTDGEAIIEFMSQYNSVSIPAIESDTGKTFKNILIEAGALKKE